MNVKYRRFYLTFQY